VTLPVEVEPVVVPDSVLEPLTRLSWTPVAPLGVQAAPPLVSVFAITEKAVPAVAEVGTVVITSFNPEPEHAAASAGEA
jgi:hypothetical protein